jgi:hypothetical protein
MQPIGIISESFVKTITLPLYGVSLLVIPNHITISGTGITSWYISGFSPSEGAAPVGGAPGNLL